MSHPVWELNSGLLTTAWSILNSSSLPEWEGKVKSSFPVQVLSLLPQLSASYAQENWTIISSMEKPKTS